MIARACSNALRADPSGRAGRDAPRDRAPACHRARRRRETAASPRPGPARAGSPIPATVSMRTTAATLLHARASPEPMMRRSRLLVALLGDDRPEVAAGRIRRRRRRARRAWRRSRLVAAATVRHHEDERTPRGLHRCVTREAVTHARRQRYRPGQRTRTPPLTNRGEPIVVGRSWTSVLLVEQVLHAEEHLEVAAEITRER